MVDDDIRELMTRLFARSRRNYAELLNALQLYVGQEHALCQLWTEEGITQYELSARMGCEPPTVTNMLKKLEENGLVYRQKDPEDGRISRVYLTDEGKALREPVRELWNKEQEKMLQGILPEERLLLRRLLHQMLDNIS